MADRDTVQLQIQPEILDVDTSKTTKSLKDRFTELGNEVTKIVNQASGSTNITPAVESAIKKVVSAYKSASGAMAKYEKATDASKKSVAAYTEALERLRAKQAELQAFQDNAPRSEATYRSWLDDVNRRGGQASVLKSIKTSASSTDEANVARQKFLDFFSEASRHIQTADRLRAEIAQLSAEELRLRDSIKIADGEIVVANAELMKGENAVRNYGIAVEDSNASLEKAAEETNTQSQTFNRISRVMSGVGRAAKQTFSTMRHVIQRVSGVVSDLYGRLTSLFKGFNKGSRGINFNSKKFFKTFLQLGLGVRSLYFLIRRMRTEFINGMKRMAASFPEVNAQVSSLAMAFNQLKGSAVTMIQPILATVIPVLVRLMNLISAVMNKIAQFFAVLRGQKVIYKAAAANVDYAGSVDDVGDSAKEANKELAEYDNLLVIPQDTAGSGGGGGGGGGDDGAYGFEEVPAVSDFAKRLKKAWEDADFEGVGNLIAKKLNSITKKVDDWILKKFEPKGKIWAERIARVANGFFDGWNAKLAGKTISDFFNAIVNIVNKFATTFNWAQAGNKIGTMIVTAIKNFDAKKAGETVRNLFEGILTAGIELLAKNPGGALGKKLADFINSLFSSDSGALGSFIGGIINNITSFFKNLFSKVDWDNIGKFLRTNFNSLADSLGFSEATKSKIMKILDPIIEVFQGIIDFIKKIDFEKVLGSIVDLLGSISSLTKTIWDILEPVLEYAVNDMFPRLNETTKVFFDAVTEFLDAIKPVLSPLLEIIMELGTEITEIVNSGVASLLKVLAALIRPIAKILGKVLEVLRPIMKLLSDTLLDLINEALELMLSLLEPLEPILETLFEILEPIFDLLEPILNIIIDIINLAIKPLIHIIKALVYFLTGDFEAAGNEMKELIGDTGKTVNKLKEHFKQFTDKITALWKKITDVGKKLFTSIVNTWNKIKDRVSKLVDTIKTNVTKAWDKIKTSITKTIDNIKTKITNVWTKIKTWITTTVTNIKDKVVGAFTSIKTRVTTVFENLKTALSNIWEGIWNVIKTPINWILSGVETLVNGVIRGINSMIGALNNVKITIPDWFKDWVPGGKAIAGRTYGFNIGYLSEVSLPRLAQGAVIPPNQEFLAVLGDQSSGTNIEAPLDTIKQALAEVMAEIETTNRMPEKIQVVMPNGKVLAQTVWDEEKKLYKQTGSYRPRYV